MKDRERTGFTLLELMVVMAVIGMLAAMIFPNLGRARTRARTAKALSELKTIELALMEYYADYSGFPTNLGMSPPATNGIDKLALDEREYLDTTLPDAFMPSQPYQYFSSDNYNGMMSDQDFADSCIVFSVGPDKKDNGKTNFGDAYDDAYPGPTMDIMPITDNIYLILPVEDIRYKK